mmetsp:Transcript_16370/g.28746  ORF Transcript_16370/g.28746 Transcript_16370/m.28746 type:complete len:124 (-) Transcript_16370:63-434(-)|eukprot:CAMPEP_0197655564 /NCGR_PEP_ID=MMETSP1338-20131121/39528_1 /TAXON_ID=43686 ORGANISM="Pelagodinium beii, Strain RCC1491" /NCGR_SAMPLE_ID=MMETSP1338 /ASSEMBLY_ACC=CAM_ASM_000754 /LENGTH=123 /DNA_ID=CAMNT_0043231231 /DNA_START=41 /DNA_END=412 /DNA_ORIENTATION=+
MAMEVGDKVKVLSTGESGDVTMSNGHSFKVCGKWYLAEELEKTLDLDLTVPYITQAALMSKAVPMPQAMAAPGFQFYVREPNGSLTLHYGVPPTGYVDVTTAPATTSAKTKKTSKKKKKSGCC